MTIDKAVYDHYWEKGWVVVNGVFTREEAEATAELALSIANELMTEETYRTDQSDDGQKAPRKIDHPFTRDDRLARFATDPRVRNIIRDLIDVEPMLATDQIFMKPPRFGSAKPYHQDNSYFRVFPSDHVITAWIALDDVDGENGCLRYIDGSHKGAILPHSVPDPKEPYNLAPDPKDIDLSRESLGVVGKGGIVFHHSKALHTSHRNHSDRWRRGYATHWCGPDVTCEINTLNTAYYKKDGYAERVEALHAGATA